jgi:hypothetical protein
VTKYRKKPVVIEATQWFKDGDHPSVVVAHPRRPHQECTKCGELLCNHGKIETLEGWHIACPGDFIITGVKGEVYPCKPDIFEATYEPVSDEAEEEEEKERIMSSEIKWIYVSGPYTSTHKIIAIGWIGTWNCSRAVMRSSDCLANPAGLMKKSRGWKSMEGWFTFVEMI